MMVKNILLFIVPVVVLAACLALVIPIMGLIAILAVLAGCFIGEMLKTS